MAASKALKVRAIRRLRFRDSPAMPRAADTAKVSSASGTTRATSLNTRHRGYAQVMSAPDIELLWWAGCPSTERALAELRATLEGLGLADAEIRMTELRADEEASERGFLGSPTILIDGEDPFALDDDEVGLSCRVYRRRDGTVSPTPDPDDLRDALLSLQEARP